MSVIPRRSLPFARSIFSRSGAIADSDLRIAIIFFCCLASFVASLARAEAWPANPSGINIGSGIGDFNPGFEASGLTYHPAHGYLVVGDDGDIAVIQEGGDVTMYQMLGGDFEGIAVKPNVAGLAYIASENLNAILELSLTDLSLTGKSWPVDLPQSGGLGFEGITFIPAEDAPDSWGQACCGGFFIAGTQADSTLRVFEIDTSAGSEATITSLAVIPADYGDVSGLHFSSETALLYVLHDAANRLTEMNLLGSKIAQYDTPTQAAEEGIVIVPHCAMGNATVSLADDGGPVVTRYGDYPINCGAGSHHVPIPPEVLWLITRPQPEY